MIHVLKRPLGAMAVVACVMTVSMTMVAMGLAIGCQRSETGGIAGTETFRLVASAGLMPEVKQGQKATVGVWLERGADFKQAVTLSVQTTAGLTAEVSRKRVAANEAAEAQVTISAAADAPIGDQAVVLSATPERGESVSLQVKLRVVAK